MKPRAVGLLLAGTAFGLGAYGFATTSGRPVTRRVLRSLGLRAYLAAVGRGSADRALLRSVERACDDDDHVVPYWGCGRPQATASRGRAPTAERSREPVA